MNSSLVPHLKIKKMIRSLFFACTLLTLLPSQVKSQEARPLSLQEAIQLSLKNSPLLHAADARKIQADAQLREAKDNRLPGASVSGAYMYLANPDIVMKTKTQGGSDSSSGSAIPHVNQALYGIANISFPVFAGGKIRYGIESAKYLQQAVTLDAEHDKESVILNAINAYINLYKAAVTVDVVKENLAQSVKRDSVLSRLEQNGLLARNDLLKSELQTSNIELSLLDAESNLRMATVNMNLMLGLPEATVLHTDSTGFSTYAPLKTIDEYEQMAMNSRKDMQALSFRKMAAGKAIDIAKADRYPSLALTGGYVAADIPHFVAITNAVNVGIGLQYNIASLWKSKARVNEAKAKVNEMEASQAQLSDQIKLQVNRDYENCLLSHKKTEVFSRAVIQAEENYRITKNKYDNALVNTTDLLDANVSLLQSKINLAVSKADELLAYSKLLQGAGILTDNQ